MKKPVANIDRLPDNKSSEEQHLDMLENANPRGDDELHDAPASLSEPDEKGDESVMAVDEMMSNFNVDMSEEMREGDEMSGDEHSSGLQGGEQELSHQRNLDEGMPGSRTEEEQLEVMRREKRRVA